MTKMFLILACTLVSGSVFAQSNMTGFKVELAAMRYSTSTEGPTIGDAETTTAIYDLKIGYIFPNGIYFGGISHTKNFDVNSTNEKRSASGATLGYHNAGWFGDFSYFLNAQREVGAIEFKDGTGYGLDVGYHSLISTNFFVGLQLSYKSFSYAKVNAKSETNKEKSEMYPMFNVGLIF